MVHLYAHWPGICKYLILSLFAYPSNSSLPLSLSVSLHTNCTSHLSLSDFACGYLCMRILPSTALSVTNTHTDTLSGNLSPHRPLPIGFCARARKSISNAFFCTLLLLLLLCRSRRQALKAAKKKTKKQRISDLVLGISIYNLVLHHVVLSSFCRSLFALCCSRCCCGCYCCVPFSFTLLLQFHRLRLCWCAAYSLPAIKFTHTHTHYHDHAQVCVSFLHTFLISQFALFALSVLHRRTVVNDLLLLNAN